MADLQEIEVCVF